MGIYDRDYSRSESGFWGGDRSMVANLIIVNVGVYLAQLLFDGPTGWLTNLLALQSNTFSERLLSEPWRLLNFVTYGFAHDTTNILHILFNMFFLWFFGREVESQYGRNVFLGFYLTTLVFAGGVWMAATNLTTDGVVPLIGASGGIAGAILLFVLNWPNRVVYLWAVVPVPVWALGAFWLVGDILGALNNDTGDRVAYTAHLAGAAYGFFFYRTGWSLGTILPRGGWFKRLPKVGQPNLKIHDPEDFEDAMSEEVDEILRKIQEQGQDSLTAKERQTLERASRRYQQKHR